MTEHAMTAVPVTDAATAAPFTMVSGDAAAMVCEGDVCFLPGPAAAGDSA